MKKPFFITIDTEGDNGWDRPQFNETKNAQGVERFQKFCESFGFKPIWLTNYEMSMDSTFVKVAKEAISNNMCEIGAHIHPWNSPPDSYLTEADYKYLPYLIEYPDEVMEEKIAFLTKHLEDVFWEKIISHRAGRWATNEKYLNYLSDYGYKVDCSVTPLINWENSKGSPNGSGGPDYSDCPNRVYYPLKDNRNFYEIPMSTMNDVMFNNIFINTIIKASPKIMKETKVFNAINARKVNMLRPRLGAGKKMLHMAEKLIADPTVDYLEFMIHSSELYPGTSPKCKTEDQLNEIYKDMECLFRRIQKECVSMTFKEYIKSEYLRVEDDVINA
jgi:hypothetical protein